MFKRTLYQLMKLFNIRKPKYGDVNSLYEKAHRQIKNANSRFKLKKALRTLEDLDNITHEQYNNPTWMRNRNHTLKMLWFLKYNRMNK